jgi:hypothetical protein
MRPYYYSYGNFNLRQLEKAACTGHTTSCKFTALPHLSTIHSPTSNPADNPLKCPALVSTKSVESRQYGAMFPLLPRTRWAYSCCNTSLILRRCARLIGRYTVKVTGSAKQHRAGDGPVVLIRQAIGLECDWRILPKARTVVH